MLNKEEEELFKEMFMGVRPFNPKTPKEAAEMIMGRPFTDEEWEKYRPKWEEGWKRYY